jgi:HlyD family secretion protein
MLITMKDPFAAARITGADAALTSAQVSQQDIHDGGTPAERINLAGDIEHAQLAQAQAQKALAALEQLQQKGAASAAEVAEAQQKLNDASTTLATLEKRSTGTFRAGDVRSAQARVADAKANLQSAKIQFDNANIASPMAGTVYAIQISPWDFVPMGADLLRVADLKNVQIRAYFDEPEIGKLQAGQPVSIRWEGRPGREWHGHIKQAPVAAVALGPRSVGECIITVDDSNEDLLPNTNVMATATIQKHPHVLTIPRPALYVEGGSRVVYRVIDGRLRRTVVDTGIINLDRAEIMGGLAEGDVVALNTMDYRPLTDDLSVRTVRSAAPRPGLLSDLLRLMR